MEETNTVFRCVQNLDSPIEISAGKNTPIPFNAWLERASVPQKPDIVEAVRKTLNAE